MCRIQRSGKYPLWSRVSPRGARGLPVADECNSHPKTWCARCMWSLPTARTRSRVLNRIFLEPAGCAPLRVAIQLKHTVIQQYCILSGTSRDPYR